MAQPVPVERLAWAQREAHAEKMQAMRRAYENDGGKLPAATERIRELRHELRRWKAAVVILAAVVVLLCAGIAGLLAEVLR